MAQVLPRWEWRTFDGDLGPAEARLAALGRGEGQTSDEIYILAAGSDANVKVRDQRLDVKLLQRVDDNGLELWRPEMKLPFPLDSAGMARVRDLLGVPAPLSPSGSISLDQLLEELGGSSGLTRVVRVHKTRRRCQLHGCLGEVTEILSDGVRARTVALEDEDPGKLAEAVRQAGLDRYANTSYPSGLKELTGLDAGGDRR